MATNCSEVYKKFFDRIEEDEDFFDGYGMTTEEQNDLINERANSLMDEAINYLCRHCGKLDVSLSVITNEGGDAYFEEDLNQGEIDLLSLIMQRRYYERKVSQLTPKINALSASEIKYAYSPNTERSTYLALVDRADSNIREELSHYLGIDRVTGEKRVLEYNLPEEDDED